MPASSSWVTGRVNSSWSPASSSSRLAVRPVTSRNTESASAASMMRSRPASSATTPHSSSGSLVEGRPHRGVGDLEDLRTARAPGPRPSGRARRTGRISPNRSPRSIEREHRLAAVDRLAGDGDAPVTPRRRGARGSSPSLNRTSPRRRSREAEASATRCSASSLSSAKSSVLRRRSTSITGAQPEASDGRHRARRRPLADLGAAATVLAMAGSTWAIVVAGGQRLRGSAERKQYLPSPASGCSTGPWPRRPSHADGVVLVVPADVADEPEPGADAVVAGGATRSGVGPGRPGRGARRRRRRSSCTTPPARCRCPSCLAAPSLTAVAAGADAAVPGVARHRHPALRSTAGPSTGAGWWPCRPPGLPPPPCAAPTPTGPRAPTTPRWWRPPVAGWWSCPATRRNVKLTTPDDLALAELLCR